MAKQFSWGPAAVGSLSSAFLLTYTFLQLPIGALIDKLGTRLTFIWAMTVWSLASMAVSVANSFAGLYFLRLMLGVGEAPAFPAASKTSGDWIPKQQRAMATGFYCSGINMGSAVALPLVAWLVTEFGWRMSFIITGLIGFVWLIFWLIYYRDRNENKRVNEAENALIEAGITKYEEQPTVPLSHLFKRKSTWGITLGYFSQVYILYLFVAWLPAYLIKEHHMNLLNTGVYGMIPFICGSISAFLGGITSDWWVRKTPLGRKLPMGIGLMLGVAAIPAAFTGSAVTCLVLLSIAQSGTMFSNGPAWAASSEMAPAGQAGTLGAIQNFGGNIGGFLAPIITGFVVQATNSFIIPLVIAGTLCLLGGLAYLTMLPNSSAYNPSQKMFEKPNVSVSR